MAKDGGKGASESLSLTTTERFYTRKLGIWLSIGTSVALTEGT